MIIKKIKYNYKIKEQKNILNQILNKQQKFLLSFNNLKNNSERLKIRMFIINKRLQVLDKKIKLMDQYLHKKLEQTDSHVLRMEKKMRMIEYDRRRTANIWNWNRRYS